MRIFSSERIGILLLQFIENLDTLELNYKYDGSYNTIFTSNSIEQEESCCLLSIGNEGYYLKTRTYKMVPKRPGGEINILHDDKLNCLASIPFAEFSNKYQEESSELYTVLWLPDTCGAILQNII